jgi:hypothetical protein
LRPSHDPIGGGIGLMPPLPCHPDELRSVASLRPAVSNCTATSQNQLWYLDRIEQNSADLDRRFDYCSTG